MRKHSHGNSAALESFDSLPDDARVRLPAVKVLFGFSMPTLYRRVKAGNLPAIQRDGGIAYMRAGDLRAALRESWQR